MPTILFAYYISDKITEKRTGNVLLSGLMTGFFSSIPLVILILLASVFDLRQYFVNITPFLIDMLSFGQNAIVGSILMIAAMTIVGVISASVHLIPSHIRKPLLTGLLYTFVIGLFSELLTERVRNFFGVSIVRLIFSSKALRPLTALIIFLIIAGITYYRESKKDHTERRIRTTQTILSERQKLTR
jgi:hypothetical protein